jgi:hypothetical protein
MTIGLGVTTDDLARVGRLLRAESDGKELRKQLVKELKGAAEPAVGAARSAVMTIPGGGAARPALRPAIAKKIRPEVKLSGRWTGIRIKAKKTPALRNFPNAPKRTQKSGGWKHRVFGSDRVWVIQHGKPDWFDGAMQGHADDYKRAVREVLDRYAADLAARLDSRGGE